MRAPTVRPIGMPGRLLSLFRGALLLRWALGGWLGIEPAAVRLETEPKGRIRVAHDDRGSCSVAHTEGLVAVLVSPMRCGVDVERSDRCREAGASRSSRS